VPIVKKTFTIDMPDCPIPAGPFNKTFTEQLPSTSPVPLKVGFKGTVTVTDASGTELASVDATGTVSPKAAQLTPLESAALEFIKAKA
jgi:hypothetical protein